MLKTVLYSRQKKHKGHVKTLMSPAMFRTLLEERTDMLMKFTSLQFNIQTNTHSLSAHTSYIHSVVVCVTTGVFSSFYN